MAGRRSFRVYITFLTLFQDLFSTFLRSLTTVIGKFPLFTLTPVKSSTVVTSFTTRSWSIQLKESKSLFVFLFLFLLLKPSKTQMEVNSYK